MKDAWNEASTVRAQLLKRESELQELRQKSESLNKQLSDAEGLLNDVKFTKSPRDSYNQSERQKEIMEAEARLQAQEEEFKKRKQEREKESATIAKSVQAVEEEVEVPQNFSVEEMGSIQEQLQSTHASDPVIAKILLTLGEVQRKACIKCFVLC